MARNKKIIYDVRRKFHNVLENKKTIWLQFEKLNELPWQIWEVVDEIFSMVLKRILE